MAKSAVRDLTVGSPMKLILGFMLPLLFGMLFQQFYNMVDTIVVGQYLGVNALAGVGSTGSVNFLVLGFVIGICAGFAIPVAQQFGSKDFDALRKYVGNTVWIAVVFAAVLTAATCLLCTNILQWMDTPEDVFNEAHDYIFVIFMPCASCCISTSVAPFHACNISICSSHDALHFVPLHHVH